MTQTKRVYSSESRVHYLPDVIRSMVSGMLTSRYMAYRICRRDIKSDYSKSAFGPLWDFLDPLVLGVIFYFLFRARVFNAGDINMPYPLFVIYGLLLYQTFVESITMSLDILRRSKALLTHLELPPEAMILSVFFRVLFNSLFRIAVMAAFSLVFYFRGAADGDQVFSLLGFIGFIAVYPMFILAGLSIGIFCAPFNAVYADIGRVVRLILFPLRYVSQVLFVIPTEGYPYNWLYTLNPVAFMIDTLRMMATSGEVIDLFGMLVRGAVYIGIFLVGWLIFHISIPVLSERA